MTSANFSHLVYSTAANSTRSLDNFKELANKAPQNLDPTTATGAGSSSNADPSGTPIGGTTSSIPSPTGSSTPGGSSAGAMVSAPAWTGLFGLAAAALMLL
jgi:hypothetical protein